jgi:A/G-specific adenine glycosylase
MAPKSTPGRYLRFRRLLARWYRRHGRDLPWRRTRDPYRVLVSEIMLQQTQVSRVETFYHRFLERFPSVHDLAAAPAKAVRESWEGLGYYRRAANLHLLAREVVRERAGVIPADPAELERLPGIGRYTAGAVASFAYERPAPAVDTNVARVIRRAFYPVGRAGGRGRAAGRRGESERSDTGARRTGRAAAERQIWETAAALVPRQGKAAWTFNQAVMELGATVCTARVARCIECPVRAECRTGRRRQ